MPHKREKPQTQPKRPRKSKRRRAEDLSSSSDSPSSSSASSDSDSHTQASKQATHTKRHKKSKSKDQQSPPAIPAITNAPSNPTAQVPEPASPPDDQPPSHAQAAQTDNPSSKLDTLDSAFETWYRRAIATQFGNDLDKLRTEAADFRAHPAASVAMLSRAMGVGVGLFSRREKEVLLGLGAGALS